MSTLKPFEGDDLRAMVNELKYCARQQAREPITISGTARRTAFLTVYFLLEGCYSDALTLDGN